MQAQLQAVDPVADWPLRHDALVADTLRQLKDAVIPPLGAAGVATVEIAFEGYGDSGGVEEVNCLDAKLGALDCPTVDVVIEPGLDARGEPLIPPAQPLQAALEWLASLALQQHHPGWENNDGALGTLTIDVATRRFVLECHIRVMDYDDRCTEV